MSCSGAWHVGAREGAALAESHGAGPWRKSSYSGADSGQCCEVTLLAHVVMVRDSKWLCGSVLVFSPDVWRRAVASLFPSALSGASDRVGGEMSRRRNEQLVIPNGVCQAARAVGGASS
ncbi:DUF397 domain-containing protein [Streptomyces sp. cg28]|uniref:DUF397 domain-containing protein n=1 Tax=Streptomyces sp. cg28 TaxID=3403457 RepID=UPI003B21E70E